MPNLMDTAYANLCDTETLDKQLSDTDTPLQILQETLQTGNSRLRQWFDQGVSPEQIVYGRTWLVDQILIAAWRTVMGERDKSCSLIAVGGYGRGELHPHSDIDLLVLLPTGSTTHAPDQVGSLITLLWDIGLQVGHSVRNIQECIDESGKDLTVITNLLETRWLAGNHDLLIQMQAKIGSGSIWSSEQFFAAKLQEQAARHHKFHDTAYKLEPNIKESPGGLRDIQTIAWVTRRHFGTGSLEKLVERGFITEVEHKTLISGRAFLWKLRNTLHFLTGRCEDRLLFDHQSAVAQQLGYPGTQGNEAIEGLMKDYYRTVLELSRLNEMLLQLFQEAILYSEKFRKVVPINPHFQACNDFLEVTGTEVFQENPAALLELFLVMQQHPELKGVTAATIRLIRSHLYLINKSFRNDTVSRCIFMEILAQTNGVTDALRRMNQYGVLASYLPPFANIVGQMQYDLIHVYTVDEHTLFLIRNLRRFTVPGFAKEFPLCSRIIKAMKKPEILYIAGLFHDIAKGRGGDHSKLGCVDAEDFCLRHGVSEYHTNLVTWLVRNHLLMSTTAQRRDTSDPDVIHEFALLMGSQERLDHLYLLTVADIRATNPELWNNWKDALLITLYNETKSALHRGLVGPADRIERIQQVRASASRELRDKGFSEEKIAGTWDTFNEEYFLHCAPDEVIWHTEIILNHPEQTRFITDIQQDKARGGTSILVYSRSQQNLFAITTAALDQLGLTVTDARVFSLKSEGSLYTYMVLDESGKPILDSYRIKEIKNALDQSSEDLDRTRIQVSRRSPRHFQHFPIPTQVTFSEDKFNHRTVVEIIATDRPGLLSNIASTFSECKVLLHTAKIGTFGSRVEDVFYVTDQAGGTMLDSERLNTLRESLMRNLDRDHI